MTDVIWLGEVYSVIDEFTRDSSYQRIIYERLREMEEYQMAYRLSIFGGWSPAVENRVRKAVKKIIETSENST